MQQAYNQVQGLLNEVVPFLKRGNVAERHYSMPTGQIHIITVDKYADVFDWIVEILKSDEFAKVKKTWELCTPAVWAGYDMHGITDLAEQRLLATAISGLTALWRKGRPTGFFGRNLEVPDETINPEGGDADSDRTPQNDARVGL